MSLSLKIKTTSGKVIETEADPDLTIYDLKAICCEELQTEPELQEFLFKGAICKDDDTLEELNVATDSTLIVLLKKKKKKTAPTPPQQQTPSSLSVSQPEEKKNDSGSASAAPSMLNGGMGNLMNMGGSMESMQQSLMQNPELMKQMMNNPMMKQMMSNPDILKSLFQSSPALQQLLDKNPQLRHVLKDPSLMQHAMKAASNPEYYNEMLKNNDRALRNIEAIPGGFSALSRLYSQIQKPMESAMDDMYRQRHGQSSTKISTVDKSNGPTSEPMDNPWSTQQPQQPQQPHPNPFNNGNNGNNNMMQMMQMMNMNMMNPTSNQMPMQADNPAQMYVVQLRELRNMGFNDEQRNISALTQTGGNVPAAIQHLIGSNSDDYSKPDKNDDKNGDNSK